MKKRILLLDDEIDFAYIMKRTLEMTGVYEVRTSVVSGTFQQVARAFKPDLILLDCMMPCMDGGEVASVIQNDPELKDIPFMFLTATIDEPETRPSLCYQGEQTYLPKTIPLEQLYRHVEEHLAKTAPAEAP